MFVVLQHLTCEKTCFMISETLPVFVSPTMWSCLEEEKYIQNNIVYEFLHNKKEIMWSIYLSYNERLICDINLSIANILHVYFLIVRNTYNLISKELFYIFKNKICKFYI